MSIMPGLPQTITVVSSFYLDLASFRICENIDPSAGQKRGILVLLQKVSTYDR